MEEEKYAKKLYLLSVKCESIQRENHELTKQIIESKRQIRRARKMRIRLLQKLDDVNDPWRNGKIKEQSIISTSKGRFKAHTNSLQNPNSSSIKSDWSGSRGNDYNLKKSMNNYRNLNTSSPILTSNSRLSPSQEDLTSSLSNIQMPMLPISNSPSSISFDDEEFILGN